jgi:transposase
MFVRKKENKSGSVSVQVISKTNGYRVLKTLGSARDPQEIDRLVELGRVFVDRQGGYRSLFPEDQHDNAVVLDFVQNLHNASIRTIGPELVFGRLFDEIGFDAIPEQLFRDVVIARLVYPTSKAKTVDYLYRYRGKAVSVQSIYRFLDRLRSRYFQQAQQIAYRHSLSILKRINVVFYDMTTLYFEAEDEDDLRKIGFSKDGKFQNPQIMLGLLVSENGYPIGYDIFEGNTFEGKTLLPVLQQIQKQYDIGKPVVIADAAMLSKDNINTLDREKYPFIVAARIRNESEPVQRDIISKCLGMSDGQSVVITKEGGHRLIVTYSEKRAKKDAYNRDRGVKRLRKRIGSGQLTKEHLNNRGYNKFLRLQGELTVELDEAKIVEAAKWDGLKGYLTNTKLSVSEVVKNYAELWQVEKAFRISKTDLRVRPMYHRRRRRIESHILIAFVAYAIYKELERRLTKAGIPLSPQRVAELTHTMYEMCIRLPDAPEIQRILLKMDADQQRVYDLLH